jgi:hypothetical protein
LDVLQRLQTLGGNVLGGLTGFNGGASVLSNLGNLGSYGGLGGSTSYGLPSWSDCDKLIRDGSIS